MAQQATHQRLQRGQEQRQRQQATRQLGQALLRALQHRLQLAPRRAHRVLR